MALMAVREGYQPVKNNNNPNLKGNLDPNNPPGKSVAKINMSNVMKNTEMKFDIKVQNIVGFSIRLWLFIRLVKLAGLILGTSVVINTED